VYPIGGGSVEDMVWHELTKATTRPDTEHCPLRHTKGGESNGWF